MEKGEIDNYLSQGSIYELFYRQLRKDFEGAGIHAESLSPLLGDPAAVRGLLKRIVERLAESGDGLQRLLYRVDVSEAQLREYSRKYPSLTFVETVAELLIRRTLQKVILRKKFSNG